jgi:ATP phosphoribosyltransferase regulatory subunit
MGTARVDGTPADGLLPFDNALPPGMRALLPAEAKFQSRVGRDVMSAFELFGYDRVWLPTFEFAHVLERTRAHGGSALRFIEPETGEVVALRSDMTPQIARVVATRFAAAPRPLRLCYQGSVVRRRKERARTESQVVQAGVELVGKSGQRGDFEVVELLCAAVRAAGLENFALDLGHSGIATSLMRGAEPAGREEMRTALAYKDQAELERAGKRAGLSGDILGALVRLPELHGGASVWSEAKTCLLGTPAASELEELLALWRLAEEAGVAPNISIDLGEIRDFDYYTGPVFQVLAHGPGEPLASGGRYDALYGRFGVPSPAAGFAIDLNHLCWALETAGVRANVEPRLAVPEDLDPELTRALRALRVCCTSAEDPETYAVYFRYDFVLEKGQGVRVVHLGSDSSLVPSRTDATGMAREISDFVRRLAPSTQRPKAQ